MEKPLRGSDYRTGLPESLGRGARSRNLCQSGTTALLAVATSRPYLPSTSTEPERTNTPGERASSTILPATMVGGDWTSPRCTKPIWHSIRQAGGTSADQPQNKHD